MMIETYLLYCDTINMISEKGRKGFTQAALCVVISFEGRIILFIYLLFVFDEDIKLNGSVFYKNVSLGAEKIRIFLIRVKNE